MHRKQATAGTYVRDWAEEIDTWITADNPFPSCGNKSTYESIGTPPTGYTRTVVTSDCVPGTSLVQQLKLEVASTDQRAREQLVIAVRKPCTAPPC